MVWSPVLLGALALVVACAVPASVEAPVPASATAPGACADAGTGCQERINLSSGAKFYLHRNFPFAGSPQVGGALIMVHGSGRNADEYFANTMRAAAAAGAAGNTMVLAPSFGEEGQADNAARWSNGWQAGEEASQPAGLSSFQVLDELVTTLADKSRFPNINRITIAGHSAGGQFTQRYAAFGLAPNTVTGVAINYVVANPSSYVYLDRSRPAGNGFGVPSTSCKYNDYKYGLDGRTGYVAKLTPEQVIGNYTGRRVTYLQSGADTEQDDSLDTDCGAKLEGLNRLARGTNYFNYIRTNFPNAPHDRIVVPGVGHDHSALFGSPLARPVLFGTVQQ